MIRYLLAILLLSTSLGVWADQPDHKSLAHAIKDLDNAMINRDSVSLKWLLEDQLTYGHSNGWIEKKSDLIADLYNGKLVYKSIQTTTQEAVVEGKAASVRFAADIDVLMDGKPMQFKLKVLQMWIWENDHWVLLARQSVKP